jgi:hypothetical protein
MKPSEREEFVPMLSAVLDLYGRKLSPGAYSIWFEALRKFELAQVKVALGHWVSQGKSQAPVPADVLKFLQADDGWIGAEEAWAMVAAGLSDEGETLCMTGPMSVAFFAALALADEPIQARMTFKEVYLREVALARDEGLKPKWHISLGHDAQRREQRVLAAVDQGRITAEHAKVLLPYLQPDALPASVQKLVAGNTKLLGKSA